MYGTKLVAPTAIIMVLEGASFPEYVTQIIKGGGMEHAGRVSK